MAGDAARLALVPLLAVAVALGATGIHGRRTHDPERTRRAIELLAPTDDPARAHQEIVAFFESGWVGWDVKTAVEVMCGTIRGRHVPSPVSCLVVTRKLLEGHEADERRAYGIYTSIAWSAAAPAALAIVLAVMSFARGGRRRGAPAA